MGFVGLFESFHKLSGTVLKQNHIGGFDRSGIANLSHGDTQVRSCQGGSVIHALTHVGRQACRACHGRFQLLNLLMG